MASSSSVSGSFVPPEAVRYHHSYQSTCSEMVFDPQCLITDRLASIFVRTLVSRTGRHWGHLSTYPLDCYRKEQLPPHFPIAVQTSCDASLVCVLAVRPSGGVPVAGFFDNEKKKEIADGRASSCWQP